jgi:tRNA(fMet)-specific endonuclease VapC
VTLFMLDTSTVSAALKGHRALDRRLTSLPARAWCISAITRSELRFGVALRPEAKRLAGVVDAFLAAARTAGWDAKAADTHGKLRASLAVAGRRIGDFDEMIAAHALSLDATLVTDNVRHFSRVPGLTTENWTRAGR